MARTRAGEIYIVRFTGAVETKPRPVVVVSSDEYHRSRPDAVLGVITSKVPAELAPSDYEILDWRAAGLRQPSMFRAFYAMMRQSQLPPSIGSLTDRDLSGVLAAAQRSLATSANP